MATWKGDTQYNTNQNNPLPEWNPEWGGYGPNPFAGYDRMAGVPEGGVDVTAMNPYSNPDDIYAAQAKNAALAAQQAAPAPTPSKPKSSSSSKSKTKTVKVGSSSSSSSSTVAPRGFKLEKSAPGGEFRDILLGLARDAGRPNTPALNLRLESARENLDKTRRSQSDTLLAQLSDLGLFGDGATYSGLGRLEENLASEYGDAANRIYADEYERADARMMNALSQLSGLQTADLDREVDWFSAQSADEIGRRNAQSQSRSVDNAYQLGLGELALGNRVAGNNYSLGLGGLQLDSDSNLIDIINTIFGGDANRQSGYR